MIDNITLDQLRTFIAAATEGSFSAAARKIGRAQSAVSTTLANLETQLGVRLFDRSKRRPVLTSAGKTLLCDAQMVAGGVDTLKARARGLTDGLESELGIVFNCLFPTAALTEAITDFQDVFPDTALKISVEGLGAVIQSVLGGGYAFGIRGPLEIRHGDLTSEKLLSIDYVMVAAASHPLAKYSGPIPSADLADHVQLVLSDRSKLTAGQDFRVFSSKTWRLSDLAAKHAFLVAGLGWGGMPRETVSSDLASGRLVQILLEESSAPATIPMSAIYRTDTPPGPAGRWLINRLAGKAQSLADPSDPR